MTLKQKIFNHLDTNGFMTDTELAKIYGCEPNWAMGAEYERQWRKLKSDREWFGEKKILSKYKYKKMYLLEIEPKKYNKCCKDYWEELTDIKIK